MKLKDLYSSLGNVSASMTITDLKVRLMQCASPMVVEVGMSL